MTDWRSRQAQQSAVLAFRMRGTGPFVLLVTSKATRRWVVPKGMIEPDMAPHESAAKEAYEEGGVSGHISPRCCGIYRYIKRSSRGFIHCTVRVFPMKVVVQHPDWPERRQRRREWMDLPGAAASVKEDGLKNILHAFRRHIETSGTNSVDERRSVSDRMRLRGLAGP